jgi:hypothetical protein
VVAGLLQHAVSDIQLEDIVSLSTSHFEVHVERLTASGAVTIAIA